MNLKYLLFFALFCICLISCRKNWFDAKPDKSMVVPKTIQDCQALLDNTQETFNRDQACLGEINSDDYYILSSTLPTLLNFCEKNGYIWASDIFQGERSLDWEYSYKQILNANVVLNAIEKIAIGNNTLTSWNNIKGSALFYRSFAFYNLSQIFCKPYINSSAQSDPGIPLKLTYDINEHVTRSSVQETYDQIINDLIVARNLLPTIPVYKTRPSLGAVYALLARVCLSMQNYQKALNYADSALSINSELLDFNQLTIYATPTVSISRFNKEVIFHSTLMNYGIIYPTKGIIDSILYSSYSSDDLRKSICYFSYTGQTRFKGSYDGSYISFGGLANDELYLIRAECKARLGNFSDAMVDLNSLLIKRWKTGTFTPLTAFNADEALDKILKERRKELCFRGLRWSDLRRLNQDPRYTVSLSRVLNNQTYILPPNDKKYVLPIPQQEIELSGIQQNPR